MEHIGLPSGPAWEGLLQPRGVDHSRRLSLRQQFARNDKISHFMYQPYALIRRFAYSTTATASTKVEECQVCKTMCEAGKVFQLECKHYHCTQCLKWNAEVSLDYAPFRAAKCCRTTIGGDLLSRAGALTGTRLFTYVSRMEERLVKGNRLYCYDDECNQYIPKGLRTARAGTCLHCLKKTCKKCGHKAHMGACLLPPVASLQMDDLIVNQNWQACPGCGMLIEKTSGCNHITCICGQDFCYECGGDWTITHSCAQ